MEQLHSRIRARAIASGASDAAVIAASQLVVEQRLADYCANPKCPQYGRGAGCPPHVGGPAAFRRWRDEARHALAIRLDVAAADLFGEERLEVMRLLHQVVADAEMEAVSLSYAGARGFAGGSCRQLFCAGHDDCLRLMEPGVCRNPLSARPSLSGFGVDVGAMMAAAGWPNGTVFAAESRPGEWSWVAGLVLLGKNKQRD